MAPAHSTTSRVAVSACLCPALPPRTTSAPEQRSAPSGPRSNNRRLTCAPVHSVKLLRPMVVGRRKALAAFQRQPLFWLTSK